MLTASRSSEVLKADWNEIDREAAVWTVPAARMKAGREHRVPLSDRALGVLDEARRQLTHGNGAVFPSSTGILQGPTHLSHMLQELGIDAVPHGFRSSFRDWAAECTDAPRDVCELALAHVNRDRVEAAYMRTDLFDRRRAPIAGAVVHRARTAPRVSSRPDAVGRAGKPRPTASGRGFRRTTHDLARSSSTQLRRPVPSNRPSSRAAARPPPPTSCSVSACASAPLSASRLAPTLGKGPGGRLSQRGGWRSLLTAHRLARTRSMHAMMLLNTRACGPPRPSVRCAPATAIPP